MPNPATLPALTATARYQGRSPRAHTRPPTGLQGKSSPASPGARSRVCEIPDGSRQPPRRERRFLSAPRRANRQAAGRRPGGLGSRRTRLLPWAAAPRTASSSVASSASSGGRAPRRRGRCIPPLAAAAAAAATAPRPRAEHPRALPGVPATSSRLLSPQDAGDVGKVLCPSNLLLGLRPAASGPCKRRPFPALRLQPRFGRPVRPGLSVSP